MSSRPSPEKALPVDAFGDGGFRIEGARHEGHVLIHHGHVLEWGLDPNNPASLKPQDFQMILSENPPDILVLGVGERMRHPPAAIRKMFKEAGVGLEVLDTASACRVYNMIGSDARWVSAALIAV